MSPLRASTSQMQRPPSNDSHTIPPPCSAANATPQAVNDGSDSEAAHTPMARANTSATRSAPSPLGSPATNTPLVLPPSVALSTAPGAKTNFSERSPQSTQASPSIHARVAVAMSPRFKPLPQEPSSLSTTPICLSPLQKGQLMDNGAIFYRWTSLSSACADEYAPLCRVCVHALSRPCWHAKCGARRHGTGRKCNTLTVSAGKCSPDAKVLPICACHRSGSASFVCFN